MAEIIRLNKVLRELNISLDRAVDFLETKNVEIETIDDNFLVDLKIEYDENFGKEENLEIEV